MSRSAGEVRIEKVCAAITAATATTPSHLLVRGGAAVRVSNEESESVINESSGLYDMFKRHERRNQKYKVETDEQSDPCSGFMHEIRADERL